MKVAIHKSWGRYLNASCRECVFTPLLVLPGRSSCTIHTADEQDTIEACSIK